MLDIKFIESHPETVKQSLIDRANGDPAVVDELLRLNSERKKLLTESERTRAQQKARSKEMPRVMKSGSEEEKLRIKQELKELSDAVKAFAPNIKEVEDRMHALLLTVPNLVSPDAPKGKDETENVVIRTVGTPPKFSFTPKNHWDIAEQSLGLNRGAKLSGARFACYSGPLAQLERALINYMLDTAGKNGFAEIVPPVLVSRETMTASGQLPKFEDDAFRTTDDMFLIPTAEVSLMNLHRGEIVETDNLPIRYTAYTPCFRREAGSYGKDTRGIIRLHQFHKVELVALTKPEHSTEEHAKMLATAESVLQGLGLAYRIVDLCTGDLGFNAMRTFDIEVWLPGQNTYREISSVSVTGDFQARRAGIRYRDSEGKPQFVHALNGSCLAVDRTMVAIMENYQNEDGSITIPEALQSYMAGISVIHP